MPVEVPDKLAHLTEYSIGGFLAARAFALIERWPDWLSKPFASTYAAPLLGTVLCALWGVLDEVHQSYVPLRTPDVHDALADLLGAALGASLFVCWVKLRATAALARASR